MRSVCTCTCCWVGPALPGATSVAPAAAALTGTPFASSAVLLDDACSCGGLFG